MLNRNVEKLLTRYITEHKESIYRLAYSYVKNKEDALDIVQDAVYKAITNIDKLNNPESIKSWFYRIVVNTALDFIRKNKRIYVMDHQMIEPLVPSAEDVYIDFDLNESLDHLPIKYRSVIILRYFEDMKIDEVADVLGENVNTIKTRLYQALQLLQIKLKDETLEGVKEHG